MSTKVRGDKIKEGSIPFSALSKDVKYVTGSYDVEAVFDAAGTYPFNFADYYFCKVGNKFVSLSGIGDGRSIQIFDGPPVYIRYEYNGIHSTCVITDVAGYITKERPVEIVTINKSNSLFLPDDIGGADWNAQEGEAGYIDNKPFGDTLNTPITEKYDFEFVSEEGDAPVVYVYKTQLESSELYIKYPYYCGYEDNTQFGYDVAKLDTKNELYVSIDVLDFRIEAKIHVIPSQDEMEDDVYELYIRTYDYENLKSLYVFEDSYTEILKPIPSVYLPNTVIKTTPQSLSDTAKNQALANLGIDPVVWKYITDPLWIIPGSPIPEDLANIIYDYDAGMFNSIIKNVCVFYTTTEEGDRFEYIFYINLNDDVVYTRHNTNTIFKYKYNYTSRTFTEY